MSTVTSFQTNSTSSAQTEALAEKIGRVLKGGEVIELASDLGGGKTTFVRGLARGAGSKDKVASPTFTISKIYQTGAFEINHFDFYRLSDPGIVADELAEAVGDPEVVVVIEWADVVHDVLPAKRLQVQIAQTPTGTRSLTFRAPASLHYLIQALQ